MYKCGSIQSSQLWNVKAKSTKSKIKNTLLKTSVLVGGYTQMLVSAA